MSQKKTRLTAEIEIVTEGNTKEDHEKRVLWAMQNFAKSNGGNVNLVSSDTTVTNEDTSFSITNSFNRESN